MKHLYRFPDRLRYENYFRFDKKWIEDLSWAGLPKASQAVLPVIAAHCNWRGHARPGEVTIAALSGLSVKGVQYGLKGLGTFRGLVTRRYGQLQNRGPRSYRVRMPPSREKDRYFPIYKVVFEGGNWQALSRSGRALYPVLRWVADAQGTSAARTGKAWDECMPVPSHLAKYAGISRPSAYAGLEDLARKGLAEPPEDDRGTGRWKIYLLPVRRYDPEVLSGMVALKFGKRH